MGKKIIPDNLVDQLCRQGLSDPEIARYLLDREGLSVTPNAITAWRRRRGHDRRRPRYARLIPWRVRVEHSHLYLAKLLRWEARLRAELPVEERHQQELERYKARLAAAFDGRGGVIHYDPKTPEGWWVVERRPGIDLDLIREPVG